MSTEWGTSRMVPAERVPARFTLRGLWLSATVLTCGLVLLAALVSPPHVREPTLHVLLLAVHVITAMVPLILRARPRGLWTWWLLAWLCAAASTSMYLVLDVGYRTSPDILIGVCGYVFLASWVAAFTYRVAGRRVLVWALTDTALLTLGWVLLLSGLGPGIDEARGLSDLTWLIYPAIDMLTLGFVGQLLFRVRYLTSTVRWFLPALAFMLLLDVTVMLRHFTDLNVALSWTTTASVLANLAALGGVTQSQLHRVTARPPKPVLEDSTTLRNLYVLAAVAAATVGLVAGAVRSGEALARSVFVMALLVLLVARLVGATLCLSKEEQRSKHRATHDELTGLLNRAGLYDELETRLERNRADRLPTALLFIDCDAFKDVNDTWGHPVGDQVLRHLARRLTECTEPIDIVARHGADDFIVVTDGRDTTAAMQLALEVQEHLGQPVVVYPGHGQELTHAIGVAVTHPCEDVSSAELVGRADIALHRAKEKGRGECVLFDEALKLRTVERALLSEDLRRAVSEDRLTVEFQPICSGSGYQDLAGWEALARWHHPVRGVISPSEFIPLAENIGLIDRLGEQILRRACREFAVMQAQVGRPGLTVSVNVAAPQLLQPYFPEVVAHELRCNGLSPGQLILEITESQLVAEASPAVDTLHRLREVGVSVSLDDFGTGYSSITAFLRLPIDGVKIDGSLVSRLDDDPASVEQVRAILNLVRSNEIERITAERVETLGQAVTLAVLGCPQVQGFLFGRPVPSTAVLAKAPIGSFWDGVVWKD